MATQKVLFGGQLIAVDDTTGELVVKVSGLVLDPTVDMGDVNLLSATGVKINPATQETLAAILAKIIASPATEAKQDSIVAALLGTGLPIPLTFADTGDANYTAALNPNPITRACKRLRVIVGNSGVVISLDGGVTDHYTLPANMAEDIAIAIPSGSDVRVKRHTAGTAITGLIVEVR